MNRDNEGPVTQDQSQKHFQSEPLLAHEQICSCSLELRAVVRIEIAKHEIAKALNTQRHFTGHYGWK